MTNNNNQSASDSIQMSAPTAESNRLIEKLLALPRPLKRVILFLGDYAISIACLFFSLSLRHGVLDVNASPILISAYALIPVIGLYLIGFYEGVTRIFFETDMRRVLLLFVAVLIAFSGVYLLGFITSIPRSVPAPYLFLLFIWLWTSRLTLRELLSKWQGNPYSNSKKTSACSSVIIYGAGSSGRSLFEAIQETTQYKVVAFVDDDIRLAGARILGKKIYPAHQLKDLIERLSIAQVFLAMPSIGRTRRRQIIDGLTDISVQIKQLPSLQEIVEGKVTVSTMRRVDILDVLDRQTVEPDLTLLQKNIAGKNILVTGAGGSIGSELCRQIVKNRPNALVLYELSEYALYAIHQELLNWQAVTPEAANIRITALLGNVTNQQKLRDVFEFHNIHTVYHAAAYKHVPIVERNPFEGAINNAKGTYHCVRAAINANVGTFVLVSTDKAVRPTNVMGASKRLAELVCQAFSNTISLDKSANTKISMVRFGNVLGSSGSVVPLFTKQIQKGGPITVTDPEVTRYFMTIPEAANLVIQAGAMAKGGEVFVLNMGAPVKIVDLAKRMIHLSGYEVKNKDNPDGDIEIVFSGLRPGEKLYEELIIGDDNIESTEHPLIMQAIEHCFELSDLETMLFELRPRAKNHDTIWLTQKLSHYVEGYQPDSHSVSKSIKKAV